MQLPQVRLERQSREGPSKKGKQAGTGKNIRSDLEKKRRLQVRLREKAAQEKSAQKLRQQQRH